MNLVYRVVGALLTYDHSNEKEFRSSIEKAINSLMAKLKSVNEHRSESVIHTTRHIYSLPKIGDTTHG